MSISDQYYTKSGQNLLTARHLFCTTTRHPVKQTLSRNYRWSCQWEVLDHPPNSPDLSPTFPELKKSVQEICNDSTDVLECAVNGKVRRSNLSCLATGSEALPKEMEFCHSIRGRLLWWIITDWVVNYTIYNKVMSHWSIIFDWSLYYRKLKSIAKVFEVIIDLRFFMYLLAYFFNFMHIFLSNLLCWRYLIFNIL